MSHFLDRLSFFTRAKAEFADGHGVMTTEDRSWEDGYRKRWQHDKIVRSTHGVNCTGSCSWKVYVKGGIVTWETQQTDYPRTRPDLPNHEPRGCARGASYSWYLYSGNRVKYPLVRSRLLKLWREARVLMTPVAAWKSIVEDPKKRASYVQKRGLGGFVRASWAEVNEIVAVGQRLHRQDLRSGPRVRLLADPGDVDGELRGRRPLSVAARRRLHVVLRLVLRFAAGLAADLGRADRRAGKRRLVQFRLPDPVGIERPADPHARCAFLYRGPLQGRQERRDLPGLFGSLEIRRSLGIAEAGHRRRAGDGDGPRHPEGIPRRSSGQIFQRLCAPVHGHADAGAAGEMQGDGYVPERFVRASDFVKGMDEANNPEWKTVAYDETTGEIVVPNGSVGFRWGEKGKWSLEEKASRQPDTRLRLSLADIRDELAGRFPVFRQSRARPFRGHRSSRCAHAQRADQDAALTDGETWWLRSSISSSPITASIAASAARISARAMTIIEPYTPAWAEKISGVPRDQIVTVAREFALNAEKTGGRSMVIVGAGLNHWYHMDMNYRGIINMLVMCGCVGQSGGGWSHYVGQEKLRPQSGWTPLAFGLDWGRPPRQMNSTSAFYAHTDQWRYETLDIKRDPVADGAGRPVGWRADRLQRARRADGLAAFGAAAANQSARSFQTCRGGRAGAEGLCRKSP